STAIEVKLCEFPCTITAGIELLDQVLIRIPYPFDLLPLQAESFRDNRIRSIFSHKKIRDDRFRLSVTRYSSNTLFVHAGTPIQFTEHDRTGDLLQSVKSGAGPQRKDQNVGLTLQKGLFGFQLFCRSFGPGIHDWFEVFQLGVPDAVYLAMPAAQNNVLARFDQQPHKVRHVWRLRDTCCLPQHALELLRRLPFLASFGFVLLK